VPQYPRNCVLRALASAFKGNDKHWFSAVLHLGATNRLLMRCERRSWRRIGEGDSNVHYKYWDTTWKGWCRALAALELDPIRGTTSRLN
jgi:hypothetical protein